MTVQKYDSFSQQKPVISIDDTTGPLDEVHFPSVTVCNMNQVSFFHFSILIFSFQFRMSQVNRMGLDPKKQPNVFRTFLIKYLDSLTGEDDRKDVNEIVKILNSHQRNS